jgi:hypothetical protein
LPDEKDVMAETKLLYCSVWQYQCIKRARISEKHIAIGVKAKTEPAFPPLAVYSASVKAIQQTVPRAITTELQYIIVLPQ